MCTLARLGFRPPGAKMAELMARAGAVMGRASGEELALLAWALAQLRYWPGYGMSRELYRCVGGGGGGGG
jgi:hypothetical protein